MIQNFDELDLMMGMFPCRICGGMWFSGGPPHRCFDTTAKALSALIAECEFANTRCAELHKHTAIDFQLLDEARATIGERTVTFCGGLPTLRDVAGRPVGKLIFDDDHATLKTNADNGLDRESGQ